MALVRAIRIVAWQWNRADERSLRIMRSWLWRLGQSGTPYWYAGFLFVGRVEES